MRFSIVILLIISALQLNAQEVLKLHRTLQWQEQPKKMVFPHSGTRNLPSFTDAFHEATTDYLPLYFESLPLRTNGNLTATITNAVYAPLDKQAYSPIQDKSLRSMVEVTAEKGFERKQPVASLSLVPLRKNPTTGEIEKLVEFDIELRITSVQHSSGQRRAPAYASNSVLSSGSWYRVSVTQDGIYRMDYNFLKNLGLDVDNIDPRNLRLYGNGGGMVPEKNADFRHDDLAENSIRVVGESDGSFDPGDYVLFYGQGPHRWSFDATGQRYHHQMHLYADLTYYFITADKGPAKTRWTTSSSLTGATATVTAFDDYAFHELEELNLMGSGRAWFGDYFNFSATSKAIPFSFPGLVTSEPVYIKSALAARSTLARTYFTLSANGQTVVRDTFETVGMDYTDTYAWYHSKENAFSASGSAINVAVNYSNSSSGAEGWLDFIELNVRRSLTYSGIPLIFRDGRTVGAGNRSEFVIQSANANMTVLDVTDPVNVFVQQYNLSGSEARFTIAADSLREFIAFVDGSGMLIPTAAGTVANQDLHGTLGQPDMIIITHGAFKAEADALANHHRTKNHLSVFVVDVMQIYNEFSNGVQDISGIRDFVRMPYVRAGSDTSQLTRFLLFFGDGSYDYKDRVTNNNNYVPTYQSANSLSPTITYASDDFFGFLDESEGAASAVNRLDVAIGRLPAKTAEEGRAMVDKIIHYQSTDNPTIDPSNCADGDCSVFGNWRNNITFIADDEDGNLHIDDANNDLARYMEDNHPEYNIDKIFLDAYPQQSTPGGSRYPDVNDAITRRIFAGTLIMNYTGHGGVNGWAHERILDISGINSWNNSCKLPLFITATCEFSRFDDPEKVSAGEMVLLNPNGGAVAMVTTTRLVYAGENLRLNLAFLQKAFVPVNGRMPTIGEAMMQTKNAITLNENNRKFILLGDPAVMLAYPQYNVVTTQINTPAATDDTLKALRKITVKGEVRDNNNAKMTTFNGTVYPTIYDKAVQVTTLKNDGGNPFTFSLQKNVLYNGKASVNNGEFSFTFIVPKDIAYNYGAGKISYYSDNTQVDANGNSTITIGGTATDFEDDKNGPKVDVFMNNEKFAFGGTTDENPILLVKLTDSSGINTVGTGIGHDITGLMDENSQKTFVLNEYYEAALDDYQKGEVRFPLSKLENGNHTMMVKAWDVHNNSSEGYTEFVVADDAELALSHVLNYPNPFTTKTEFLFEHNCACKELFVTIKILTVSGKVVKTIDQHVLSDGFRTDGIFWDGLDEYGETIGRGVYVYKLNVRTPEGASAHEFQKLVILR